MNVPSLPRIPTTVAPNEEWIRKAQAKLAWLSRAVAFWLAIALPFLYLPLLAGGLDGKAEAFAFVGLMVVNLVALVVGHEYGR